MRFQRAVGWCETVREALNSSGSSETEALVGLGGNSRYRI